MSQVSKPTLLWSGVGMIVLLLVFNKWMSAQIEPPASVAPTPAAVTAEPAVEKALPAAPLPPQVVEEEPAPLVNAQTPVVETGPKEGERVLEPIYEPPKNDVILVN